jgi:hypothetical protein
LAIGSKSVARCFPAIQELSFHKAFATQHTKNKWLTSQDRKVKFRPPPFFF